MQALINMVSILLVFKVLLLVTIFGVFVVSYFHTRETLRMEKRLGLVLPNAITTIISSHVAVTFLIFILFTVLFFV